MYIQVIFYIFFLKISLNHFQSVKTLMWLKPVTAFIVKAYSFCQGSHQLYSSFHWTWTKSSSLVLEPFYNYCSQ